MSEEQNTPNAPEGATQTRACSDLDFGSVGAYRWQRCPACHLRVWLTNRGKRRQHFNYSATNQGLEFAVLSSGGFLKFPRCPNRKVDTAPPAPEVLADLLSLVMQPGPTPATIATWTDVERRDVEAWAAHAHLQACDNLVTMPPRPAVLDREAGS